ncbi:hypothetical protein RhiirA4_473787 [Rhizophagus irregularis]|uniref:Uncharacterized protein n=1 Tax=Rhizophagus irregularis TaxID=588596 RepID=A0A2I1H7C8_9GLOM|nr:hypothetical protein RhiirA4_473787 [Rhizophagus irregularis]
MFWYLVFGVSKSYFTKSFCHNTQRLVAYFLVRKVIEELFKSNIRENRDIEECADPTLTPKDIITLNQAESSKFSYIIGWVLFKLLKRDHLMNSHPKFPIMHTLLGTLCIEKVEYVVETKTWTTNIIPGPEFICLLSNSPLNQKFIPILNIQQMIISNWKMKNLDLFTKGVSQSI